MSEADKPDNPLVISSLLVGGPYGGRVSQDPATDLLTINDEFTASIVIIRCRETPAGSLRWHVRLDAGLSLDEALAKPTS